MICKYYYTRFTVGYCKKVEEQGMRQRCRVNGVVEKCKGAEPKDEEYDESGITAIVEQI